ncbi:hypothetical protein GGS24DRAFT_516816 [Hypoxylon argillaceum]|nr:hypothetical protein GGS24DRAFT_516816 [Hypoxylon argillaceum]
MVQKSNDQDKDWCFPQCFEYIMQHQLPSGRWLPYATLVDGILNTAAALLAPRKHLRTCPENVEWLERSVKAEKALGEMHDSLNNLFGRSRTAYIAEDLCRHLSSLCRMYNDYGSLQRGIREWNLNSINFPEFAPLFLPRDGTAHVADDNGSSRAKAELLCLAGYERRGVEMALDVPWKELKDGKGRYVVGGLRFFINITDLFGQIYVLKDVGLRNRHS